MTLRSLPLSSSTWRLRPSPIPMLACCPFGPSLTVRALRWARGGSCGAPSPARAIFFSLTVFEEPGFVSTPWAETYGIQTKYGVPKPCAMGGRDSGGCDLNAQTLLCQ